MNFGLDRLSPLGHDLAQKMVSHCLQKANASLLRSLNDLFGTSLSVVQMSSRSSDSGQVILCSDQDQSSVDALPNGQCLLKVILGLVDLLLVDPHKGQRQAVVGNAMLVSDLARGR